MRARGILAALAVATLAAWPSAGRGAPGGMTEHSNMNGPIDDATVRATVDALVATHGETARGLADAGVRRAAMFWRAEDGTPAEFQAFCAAQFVSAPDARASLLERFRKNTEALSGHRVALTRTLREETDLDALAPLPVDLLFATLDPFVHLSDDVFRTRVAFVALLNFPESDLAAPGLNRDDWAATRLVQSFALRIPGDARQAQTAAYAAADDYIANYNVHLDALVAADGSRPFPGGPRLITHWGLRDHIKALYADPAANLAGQRLIAKVMDRILRQEIPAVVIDNPDVAWDPVANTVAARKPGAPAPAPDREADVRYAKLLSVFSAERGVDAYSPRYPTHIARKFDYEREIPEAEVEALLKAVLSAPVAKDVAKTIRKRLGRPLEPFDIWYDGFKVRSTLPGDTLDAAVRGRYPTRQSFQDDLPAILGRLGFAPDTAAFLADHIVVDGSRGAGHAMGAGMRTDSARLRTRVGANGMDYKGYNIALHELGHCVEQVFTLNRVDSTLMMGVPNTAFTEAFAFLFQERDLDVLGFGGGDAATRKALRTVDAFWMTFEIAGVSLLDMAVWRWLYANPDATPAQLRQFTIDQAVAIWNRYFAPVLGVRDSAILAIYSHMIVYGLYLPDYAIGHLVHAQIEDRIEGRNLATEMERMCVQGRLTPDAWMRGAVDGPLSADPLIRAAKAGLKAL